MYQEIFFLGREAMKYFFIFDNKKMEEETKRLLAQIKVNIPDLKIPVGYLSGGQRQSIAIARAMCEKNQFIILDEPTSAMRIKESHAFLKLIKKLPLINKGILIISHNLEQIYSLVDRVYIMHQGKLSKSYLLKDYTLEYT